MGRVSKGEVFVARFKRKSTDRLATCHMQLELPLPLPLAWPACSILSLSHFAVALVFIYGINIVKVPSDSPAPQSLYSSPFPPLPSTVSQLTVPVAVAVSWLD